MNTQPESIGVLDASTLTYCGHTVPRRRAFSTLAEVATAARDMQLAQLWLTHDACPSLDVRELGGWDMTCNRPERPERAFWFSGWQPGTYGKVEVVVCGNDDKGIFRDVADGRTLYEALHLYREQTGIAFRWGAGSTGVRLIRQLHSGAGNRLTLDLPGTPPPPALEAGTEIPLDWQRPLTREERKRRYLHSYDKNGQYLAAASSLSLGLGCDADHLTAGPELGAALDERHPAPGYWRVHVRWMPDLPNARLLPLAYRLPRRGTLAWITTPTLLLLRELGCDSAVTEAYIWREAHRPLEPWYKRLRDARQVRARQVRARQVRAPEIALAMVKATYAQTSGYLSYKGRGTTDRTEGDTLYRPDWRHAWIAQAKANLYRRMAQAARDSHAFPFAVGKDCLYYASDEPDAEAACPPALRLDETLGGWKVKDAAVPLADALPIMDANSPAYLHELQVWLNCRRDGSVYEPEYVEVTR